jgi:protein-S-isoprenylcysteine O-methyltransferase Ste14
MEMQAELTAGELGPQPLKLGTGTLILDLVERAFVLALGSFMVCRFLPTLGEHPVGALLLLSEALICVFVVIRRFGPAVNTGRAWLTAVVGTCAPLLVVAQGHALAPMAFGTSLMILGCLLSIGAKLVLRRSFGIVAANRGVQRVGPYRLVRHPMYLGYLLAHLGFLSLSFSAWNALVYVICWLAMLLRIAAEESILGQDPEYRAYRTVVGHRLLPGLW